MSGDSLDSRDPDPGAVPRPRSRIREIFAAAVSGGDPATAVRAAIRSEGGIVKIGERRLQPGGRVVLLAVGKAAVAMAQAAAQPLRDRLAGGLVITTPPAGSGDDRPGEPRSVAGLPVLFGDHPLPGPATAKATRRLLELADRAGTGETVLVLLSGGASALLEEPAGSLTREQVAAATTLLLGSGASIGEINTVRRALSAVKGGGLARRAAPARVITLALSDVPGDRPWDIGSGPTVPSPTGTGEALDVLRAHDLLASVPAPVVDHLGRARPGAGKGPGGSPDRGARRPGRADGFGFPRAASFHLVGDNRMLLVGAERSARKAGLTPLTLGRRLTGEARELGTWLAALGRAVRAGPAADGPYCLLSAGESTVTVQGGGIGGRNQELALAAAIHLDGTDGIWFCSAGSDGIDGPTAAAGAIVDGTTCERGRAAGRDPVAALRDNDAHTFLDAVGDTLVTGPTGTNLMDLQIVIVTGGAR